MGMGGLGIYLGDGLRWTGVTTHPMLVGTAFTERFPKVRHSR